MNTNMRTQMCASEGARPVVIQYGWDGSEPYNPTDPFDVGCFTFSVDDPTWGKFVVKARFRTAQQLRQYTLEAKAEFVKANGGRFVDVRLTQRTGEVIQRRIPEAPPEPEAPPVSFLPAKYRAKS